jgi:hypothetical protein
MHLLLYLQYVPQGHLGLKPLRIACQPATLSNINVNVNAITTSVTVNAENLNIFLLLVSE